jgi:hypothetical protein
MTRNCLPILSILPTALLFSCSTFTDTFTGQTEEQAAVQLSAKPFPCSPNHQNQSCKQIKEFAEIDLNRDALISISRELNPKQRRLAQADLNEDKKISLIEFMTHLDKVSQSRPRERICVRNLGKKSIHWAITDPRLNARDEGFVATMGNHLPQTNRNGMICTEVADREGPYVLRAEMDGSYCMIPNLVGNTWVNIQDRNPGRAPFTIQCTPQRDGFHGVEKVAKEFRVEYAKVNKSQKMVGLPFREISLRNQSPHSSFQVTLKNPQGRNLNVILSPLSGYRFDLNTPVDEFYQPIEIELKKITPNADSDSPQFVAESKSVFPAEKNLQCQFNTSANWTYKQKCNGALVGSYGFVSDINIW